MFIKKISLYNFRQFYGRQEIVISTNPEKNVTLIHAENGVGKTTILNAVLWCFYKDTTNRFEQPEKIANNQAISEGDYNTKVEVTFDHDGNDYLVAREFNQHNQEESFKAFQITRGNYVELDSPTGFVESVVPQEMARYFFFDGEYAETFSSQNNKSKVREALEDMLGCRTANAAIKDLQSLQSELEKQISGLTRNNQAEMFQENMNTLTAQNERDQANIIMLENNLEAAKDAQKDLMDKLRGTQGASDIQKRRESLEKENEKWQSNKTKLEGELCSWIGDGGLSLISGSLETRAEKMLEEAKVQGKIPSYIADTFVKDLLKKRSCICGRSFEEHSGEAEAIQNLLQDAGTAIANDRLMDCRALMGGLSEKRIKAHLDVKRIRESIENCIAEINAVESKIEECTAQLRGSDVSEIAEKEAALARRTNEVHDLIGKIRDLKFECERRESVIQDNKNKRDKLLSSNERAASLQMRWKLLAKTIDRIEKELEKYREQSRTAIVQDVNRILDETARRDYYAIIDDKFNLDMARKETNASVARSSGENQLLSLAFIAALIKFSAARMSNKSEILKPGTSAPLVLDSPFGQLDPTYQEATAKFLPHMAKQVILLISQAQGKQVMDILKDRIGKEYVLISENTASKGDKPEDIIMLGGNKMATSLYGREKTYTRIEQIGA